MDKVKNEINNFLNKDITKFVTKYKIPLLSALVLVLLVFVGFIATYAYYKVEDSTPVVGGATGDIADIVVRIMAEERDALGQGTNTYGSYAYIPQAGYQYNSSESYCVNGSTINYDSTTYSADITATGHDVCYLYFDSTDVLDITLYVYAENVDSTGNGTGNYTLLQTTSMPSVGYEMSSYSCVDYQGNASSSTVTYNLETNLFTVNAVQRADVCTVYMDAISADIILYIYVQPSSSVTDVSEYTEVDDIPSDKVYSLNSASACTGELGSTLSLSGTVAGEQTIEIAATEKTTCIAYLDIAS